MLLNNERVAMAIKEELKPFLETNPNEHTATRNRGDAAKAVLRGKFIALQAHPKKQEKALTGYRKNSKAHRKTTPEQVQ